MAGPAAQVEWARFGLSVALGQVCGEARAQLRTITGVPTATRSNKRRT